VSDRDPEMMKRAREASTSWGLDLADKRRSYELLHDFAAAEVERALADEARVAAQMREEDRDEAAMRKMVEAEHDERQARLERFACAAMGPCVTAWCEGGQTLDDCVDTAMQVAKAMLAESDRIREEWEKA
jgi:hypothetical protein